MVCIKCFFSIVYKKENIDETYVYTRCIKHWFLRGNFSTFIDYWFWNEICVRKGFLFKNVNSVFYKYLHGAKRLIICSNYNL